MLSIAVTLLCLDPLSSHTFFLSKVLLVLYLCITNTLSSICNGVQFYFPRVWVMDISGAIFDIQMFIEEKTNT